jgi:hypothetical protein
MLSTGEKVGWRAWLAARAFQNSMGVNSRQNEREMCEKRVSRKERERSNEQERIENDWFTSRGGGGCVTARQDHWMTTKTLATVHGQTLNGTASDRPNFHLSRTTIRSWSGFLGDQWVCCS